MRGVIFGVAGSALLVSMACEVPAASPRKAPSAATTKYDRVTASGNLFYRMPEGMLGVAQDGGVILVAKTDLKAGLSRFILVTDGTDLDAATRSQLQAAGKEKAIGALAVSAGGFADDIANAQLSTPERVATRPDGSESYEVSSVSDDKDAGRKRYTQYHIILGAKRVEIIMMIGYDSADNLQPLIPYYRELVGSLALRSAGAKPPARLAPPFPTDLGLLETKP